jgi:iron complex outermembrane recepter protein
MKKKHILSVAIHLIVIGATGVPLCLSQAANAEEAVQVDEIVVTGSAIKRKDLEGALPVQVFSREQLDRTGVVTTAELMDTMTAMQGFTTVSDSVGGGGGGIRTASIHDIGDDYTLVLLNGRRMAPSDSGGVIDIGTIPLSMLKQVDVLTDGAGALYGSDAIAGVVNFQLKEEVESTTVSARYSVPLEGAGETLDADLITGFGSMATDGFALVLGYNHHDQKPLEAADRDFAKTGILTVEDPNTRKAGVFFQGSGNAIPGNTAATYIDTAKTDKPETTRDERLTTIAFNPYLKANGSCAPSNSQVDNECFYDFTSALQVIPESVSDSLFLNGHYKVTDDLTAFATMVYAKNSLTSRIAPYPTGNVPLPINSALVNDYVRPYLTPDQSANLTKVTGRWRALPAEGRTTEYLSDSVHFVTGLDGSIGDDIDYSVAYTFGKYSQDQNYPTGWLLLDPFVNLVKSGELNIFTTPDKTTSAEKEALAKTIYHGPWDTTDVTINSIDGSASMPVFDLNGSDAILAVGFDYRDTKYERGVSEANDQEILLFLSRDIPYDMSRHQFGVYSEFLMPFTESVEVTASVRYDSINSVKSEGFGLVGEPMSDTSYKLSGRWEIVDELAVRASYGTGFKAPSMLQVAEPRTEFGVTSGNYTCPFADDDVLAAFCLPGEFQSAVYREGYAKLKPEKSKQATVGFVFTPVAGASLTVDYWKVAITDVVERLSEQSIYANPARYRDLFTTKDNLATGEKELAIIQAAVNGGKYDASGIDYDFSKAFDLSFGTLTTTLGGTYMIESRSTLNGSSLGLLGLNDAVTFRNQIRIGVTLEHDIFSHSISLRYKSGYLDQAQTVNLIGDDGVVDYSTDTPIQLTIPSYSLVNYQTKVKLMDEKLGVTFGVNNLMDKQPPLSLTTNGGGQQVGWDPRYVDAYGRTVFLRGDYTF